MTVQDPALQLLKSYAVVLSPSIQPVQNPLQSLPTFQLINSLTHLGAAHKLSEDAANLLSQVIDKDVE